MDITNVCALYSLSEQVFAEALKKVCNYFFVISIDENNEMLVVFEIFILSDRKILSFLFIQIILVNPQPPKKHIQPQKKIK